ncbi:MAG: hypothetical protein PHS73_04780, partial [Candidatus Peribacteraceae bacterium]|nr:hypothetical protein [Candidatus Peribacteraceae bacterium]
FSLSKPPMPESDDGITLKAVLDHMQNMQRVLMAEIAKLGSRVGGLETRMDTFETHMDRMEANLTRQIDAIDKRLDEIEIEKLPSRVRTLEVAVGIA